MIMGFGNGFSNQMPDHLGSQTIGNALIQFVNSIASLTPQQKDYVLRSIAGNQSFRQLINNLAHNCYNQGMNTYDLNMFGAYLNQNMGNIIAMMQSSTPQQQPMMQQMQQMQPVMGMAQQQPLLGFGPGGQVTAAVPMAFSPTNGSTSSGPVSFGASPEPVQQVPTPQFGPSNAIPAEQNNVADAVYEPVTEAITLQATEPQLVGNANTHYLSVMHYYRAVQHSQATSSFPISVNICTMKPTCSNEIDVIKYFLNGCDPEFRRGVWFSFVRYNTIEVLPISTSSFVNVQASINEKLKDKEIPDILDLYRAIETMNRKEWETIDSLICRYTQHFFNRKIRTAKDHKDFIRGIKTEADIRQLKDPNDRNIPLKDIGRAPEIIRSIFNTVINMITKAQTLPKEERSFAEVTAADLHYCYDGLTASDLFNPDIDDERLTNFANNLFDNFTFVRRNKVLGISNTIDSPITQGQFINLITEVRSINPNIFDTTDLIVGIPYDGKINAKPLTTFVPCTGVDQDSLLIIDRTNAPKILGFDMM